MIEIYKNSTEYVGLTLYSNGEPYDAAELPTVTLYDNETEALIADDEPVNHENVGQYTYLVNLHHTQEERQIRVQWNFAIGEQPATKTDLVQVVTPYVTPDEAKMLHPELRNLDFDTIKEYEKRARLIVDTITGQSFGIRRKTITIKINEGTVFLNWPLVEVEGISVGGMPYDIADLGLVIDRNGWVLRGPVKMNHFYYTSYMPELRLWKGMPISITGKFGYKTVPMDITVATAMLMRDYSCQEDIWRQRGLDAVKAADWRFEYGKNTYRGTGNVDVDLLLSKYRGFGAAII